MDAPNEVDNFITELLDQVPRFDAVTLYLNVGRKPTLFSFESWNTSLNYDGEALTLEEIIEDSEALGLIGSEKYFMQYTTAKGESLILRVITITSEGQITSKQFSVVEEPSFGLRQALSIVNPIMEAALMPSYSVVN